MLETRLVLETAFLFEHHGCDHHLSSTVNRVTILQKAAARLITGARKRASISAQLRSTQPCIPLGSLNRLSASAGVRAGMSPLPGCR